MADMEGAGATAAATLQRDEVQEIIEEALYECVTEVHGKLYERSLVGDGGTSQALNRKNAFKEEAVRLSAGLRAFLERETGLGRQDGTAQLEHGVEAPEAGARGIGDHAAEMRDGATPKPGDAPAKDEGPGIRPDGGGEPPTAGAAVLNAQGPSNPDGHGARAAKPLDGSEEDLFRFDFEDGSHMEMTWHNTEAGIEWDWEMMVGGATYMGRGKSMEEAIKAARSAAKGTWLKPVRNRRNDDVYERDQDLTPNGRKYKEAREAKSADGRSTFDCRRKEPSLAEDVERARKAAKAAGRGKDVKRTKSEGAR